MFLNRETAYKSVMDGIFDRFAQVQLEIKEVPMVMEVKPYLSYFAVKSLSRTIPTSVEYEDSRQMLAYREDYTLAQSLAFEHYLPRNITKRMNLRPARKSEAADSNQVGDANDSGDGDGK